MTDGDWRRYRGITRPPTKVWLGEDRRKRDSRAYPTGWFSPDDAASPIDPKPTPGVGPQPWHEVATWLREECGLTVRQCAVECGVGFGPMQRFLNPESKARQKARQNEAEKAKCRTDPEYAQKWRDYRRRYHQAKVLRAGLDEPPQTSG